ncbi:hypothetical protein NHH73_21525 [Oxalobacteraceae bacterium OTU3CINTB1]|nr:hypothetical protein NHH73_21525 [Oxalobacteraceae bacterium OTU3CINTB1]
MAHTTPHDIEVLRNKINDHGIFRVPPKSKEMPSMNGTGFYTWQFYLRSALLDARSLQTISHHFWSRFEETYRARPFQIAGVESAAVPIITALICSAAERGITLNAFTIRKERKAYGRRNLIEGAPNGLPVLFVDDLTSPQHNAFWHAVHALSVHGLRLAEDAYVLVRKQERAVSPYIATSIGTVMVQSLFTLDDFALELADYLDEQQAATADQARAA